MSSQSGPKRRLEKLDTDEVNQTIELLTSVLDEYDVPLGVGIAAMTLLLKDLQEQTGYHLEMFEGSPQ